MGDETWTGLADAITAIRAELQKAIAPEEGLRFRAGTVELEFTVDVRTDAHGKVKVTLLPWLGAEGGAAHSSGTAHRLKVSLQPIDAAGEDALIGAKTAERPE